MVFALEIELRANHFDKVLDIFCCEVKMVELEKSIRRYTTISAAIDILRRKKLPLLDPETWDDRNDRYFMALYREKKDIGSLYALCAAACTETYHHWRVFTGTSDGACIVIKREAFELELAKRKDIRFAKVKYLNLDDIGDMTKADQNELPFMKREAFKAEMEYRIVLEHSASQQPAMYINFPLSLIDRIYLNPWLPQSLAESISATVHELPGCSKLSILRSHLIDSATWKKAGDKIVGKSLPPSKKIVKRSR